ncbi:MAG TPA: hypothetical protein PLU10_00740 [Chitinophagaceae bacterium]|nr:hypothetical protein [Chitinophagaceae bacterium]
MKNWLLVFTLTVICFSQQLHAKSKKESSDKCVHKRNFVFSAGYGAPSIVRAFLKYKTTRDQIQVSGFGPIIFKGEYMLSHKIGIGFNASYSRSKVTWQDTGYDTVQQMYRKFEFGIKAYELSGTVRGNYHFWKRKKIDSYAGLGVGYGLFHMWSYTLAHTTQFNIVYNFPPPVIMEATWGIRYFPTKNLGIYSEVGIGKSWILFNRYFLPEALIQAGLTLKL